MAERHAHPFLRIADGVRTSKGIDKAAAALQFGIG
jgi:hypothetical protein